MSTAIECTTSTDVIRERELVDVIHSFNEVTERLKRSHEMLGGEVRRLREQIEEKDRELERGRRLAALGEMAAGVAHEIRNPLGGIGLYASLLARDLADDPDRRTTAERILSGVRNLEAIVSDILAFAGQAAPSCRPVRAARLAEEVLGLAAPHVRMLGVRVDTSAAWNRAELDCDERQISRALLNLVLNAVDAAGRGGHIRLDVTHDAAAEGLLGLAVEDDGPGIRPEHGDRIFNPFFTTKETGTGLGLAIVHRIAEAHGGRITAANRPGGGARFTLYVPMGQGTA